MLKDMDDALASLEDAVLALTQGKVTEAINDFGMAAQDAVTKVLGDRSSQDSMPSEPSPDPQFPHIHPADEHHHPWDYPMTKAELEPTIAGPFSCGDQPDLLLQNTMTGNQALRMQFEKAADPQQTRQIATQITGKNNMGDPINFSTYLIWQLTRSKFPTNVDASRITDWNLDADRGYAYKCWDWNRFPAPPGGPVDGIPHARDDDDRHPFMDPCTPPPQATDYDPNTPLKIHYTDHPDPGCAPMQPGPIG
jgi:hypothetical protein